AMLRVLHTSITPTAGQIYPLEVVIGNTGSDTIRNATITWSFNGDTGTYYWAGTLLPISGKDTVVLDSIMFVNGNNSLSLWISNPNNLTDLNTANDTLSLLIYSCTSVLNGTYIVGNSSNADFDLAEVASILYNCGVSGPVILQMEAGIYSGLELDKVFMGVSSTNTITLTSLDRNADSVVFHDTLSALLLKDVENYAFSYITFDASSGKYGVELKGTCKNIEFYGCKIKASPTTTEETSTTSSTIGSAGVYYANTNNSSKYLDNIRFINNQIDGGSSNIFIAYMTSISSQMGTVSSVIIDSNILTNAYSQGIHSYYYGYYPSISYNTITPRVSSTAAYYGISAYFYHTIPQMVANKINISGKSTSYGVYLYAYHNYSSAYGSKGAGLLANNEVIITNATGSAYGIYVYEYSQWDIYHNSIYIASNASACYALYVQNSMVVNILNNNMVVATSSPSSYALYKTNATYATYTYGVVDYNNYYSHLSSNIAYIGGDKKSVAEIQLVSLQDIHSVSVFPSYVNPVNSLALVAEDGLACPRLVLVRENIEGKIRKNTTAMGAYATPLYEGVDLALTVFVEPSETNIACLPDFTPVKVALTNMGAQTVDFTTDSIVLHLSVDGIVSHQTSITLNIGKLELEQIDIIEFYSAFNISLPGMYNFTAWISSDIDTLYHNDTLRLDYYVDKTILPYDNDFTSGYIYTKQMYGSVNWAIIENNPTIASVYGTKSLYFNSALMSGRGSVSRAILQSVALQGTLQPTLEFWYAHDGYNSNLLDYMIVKISTDGGITFTNLQTVYRYNSAYTTPAWEHYTIDLSPYTNGNCILIAFEAASYGGGAQSIDRIRIKGKPNVAVYLDIPQLDSFEACDLDNKEINVVIENLTSQPFDLSADSVVITITGPAPQSHTIDLSAYTVFKGFAKDTFSVFANYDFSLLGNYSITADLSAVDSNMSDNIANISVLINPDIALNTVIGVDETNCKYTGDSVYITVEVINVGNLPAVGIPVNLRINNNVVLLDTILSRLEVGDTIMYTFTQPYIVPAVTKLQPYYKVDVATELSCDANLTNNKRQILACVNYINIIDLKVDSVIKPTAISCDSGLHSIYVSLILANIGETDIASAVINVDIDSAGITVDHISETCGSIAEGMTLEYEFTQAYIVPNFSGNYSVRVYLSTIDNDIDLSNDTLTVNACAIYNDVSVNDITEVDWYVGQNQPNPAQTMTEIPYAIPSDGTLNVKIMSVSGQVLYQKEIQAIAGNHNLVVDIDFLSNGIYYYSMEYEGRIIVKKMTVNK
ncbi:MAG TPA: T9SS type A sorting domain-containing protein, partial [Bacteroidales bacterium]|nr:T9SS type A sorting domain-containing protein [Bacteroidales bacterium]